MEKPLFNEGLEPKNNHGNFEHNSLDNPGTLEGNYSSPEKPYGDYQNGAPPAYYASHENTVVATDNKWRHESPQANHRIGFGGAIKNFYKYYGRFHGTASRAEYWFVQLYTLLITIPLLILMIAFLPAENEPSNNINPLFFFAVIASFIIVIAHIIPSLSLMVRRLHDVGLSGWWVLLNFIPYISYGFFVLMIFPSDFITNLKNKR